MAIFKKSLVAVGAMLAASAYALPQWTPNTVNTINFNSYENQYRSTAACAASPGTCLSTAVAPAPAGWQMVDPTIAGNLAVGDVFSGVVQIYQLLPSGWNQSATDQFTGYFSQVVTSIDASSLTNAVIQLGAVTSAAGDPFGLLAAGEMFKLYTSNTQIQLSGVTAAQSVASATDGTYWGSLGLPTSESYAYTVDDLTVSGNSVNFKAKSELALDIIGTGASYNLFPIAKANSASESPQGGVSANNLNLFGDKVTCTSAEVANTADGITCNDLVGDGDVKRNPLSDSPWFYNVNDPLALSLLPEPGSLALAGLALLGVGALRRRKAA